jgi:16S rRNA (guanine527-N7)-methyltransferase
VRINSPQWRKLMRRQVENAGIDASSDAQDLKIDKIIAFVSELLVWNEKINLTAITDAEEVAEKHIIDSLIPSKFIPANASVIDLGTGGGFPGIPLKIYMPSLAVMLVDSSRKKINFLKYVIRILNFQNISAHQFRVEELSDHPDFAGQFDVVISRAFTSLKKFLELSIPLMKPEGCIIAMKGKEVQKEIDEIKAAETREKIYQINGRKFYLCIEKYSLPVSGDERSLVIVRNRP